MPMDRIEGFQLSPQQERVWLLQSEPRALQLGVHGAIRVDGPVDPSMLHAALRDVVRRNEILRTGFRLLPGMTIPLQVITDSPPLWSDHHDWSDLSPSERKARTRQMLSPSTSAWDLEAGRVLLADLVTVAPRERILFVHLPALCADVPTLYNLVSEIKRSYGRKERFVKASDQGMQYADIAAWQRALLDKQDPRARRYYRKQNLHTVPAPRLPFERAPGAAVEYSPESIVLPLNPQMLDRAEAIAESARGSIAAFLLSCWQILLWRLTEQADLIVGMEGDGRSHQELLGALGLLGQYLPVRCRLDAHRPFREALLRAETAIRGVRGFQEYFDWKQIRESIGTGERVGYWPFGFDFVNNQWTQEADNVRFSILDQRGRIDRFRIRLSVSRGRLSSTAAFEFDQNLLPPGAVERMALQFQRLCEEACSDPELPIGCLDILDRAERRHLRELGRSPRVETGERFIHGLFDEQVARTPDSIAIEAGNVFVSYGELSRRVDGLARRLQGAGVSPDERVAICLKRSTEMVVAVLGALKAGGAYVPLDPDYPTERLSFVLENARVSVVLTRPGLLDDRVLHPGLLVLFDADKETSGGSPPRTVGPELDPLDLAYLIYTSGSTGKPKGVMISHLSLSHYLRWCVDRYGVSEGDRVPLLSPLGFDLSVTSLFCPLLVGGRLVLIDDDSEMDSFVALIGGPGEFSFLKLTPSHLDALGAFLPPDETTRTLRTMIVGGEVLVSNSIERWRRFAPVVRLVNEYGPTEATVGCCVYEIPSESSPEGEIPIGRPISGSEAYVLDPDLNLLPAGVAGELYLGGPGLARGYAGLPAVTGEKFVPNPHGDEPGARIYKTGDRARWRADDNLDFLGRRDNQVKLRGFRIELGEIESVLREHPSVEQAVVLMQESEQPAKRLAAYVVPGPGGDDSSGAVLRTFLETRLPSFMIPSNFVFLDVLPLSSNGKLDRRALPAPQSPSSGPSGTFVAPRTPLEKELARLWSEVLGVDRVGIRDNFFELGGDSILVIQVVAKARRAHLSLTPLSMFEHQTIAELATRVGASGASAVIEDQAAVEGPVPLTPIQRWFFDLEWEEPHHFNQALMLQVPRDLDPSCLRGSFENLLRHHDALRLRFRRTDGEWRQENAGHDQGDVASVFSHVELVGLLEQEQTTALESAAAQLNEGLNLDTGPLLRAALFSIRGGADRLMIVIHHLAVDGVSWGVLTEDLLLGYEQLRRGRPIELPPKTTSFRRWAERLSEYAMSSRELNEEFGFWQAMASDASMSLPLDHEGGPNDYASTETVEVSLGEEKTRALVTEAPKAYRTQIVDLLLTALVKAFAAWTGEHSLLLDLEGHGREELFDDIDVTRTVGWFTTLSPVWLRLEESGGTADDIKSIKEQLRRVPRRGIGYGLLRYLHTDEKRRDELRALSTEVCFNYLGRFRNTRPAHLPFGLAQESRGRLESPRGRRAYLIEINANIADDRLQTRWRFSRNRHQRATIEQLTKEFTHSLMALIDHCQSMDAGGPTPTDFPLAGVDQQTLDRLVGNGREVEDLYPLSPTQQGLLFHTLYAPNSAVYFEQVSVRLTGELDVAAFREAWRQVVARHAVLRTKFAWEDLEEPLSIVQRDVDLPWEEQDWRGVSEIENQRRLEEFLDEDRKRGFNLTQAPLMRLAVLQVEDDAWYLVWSHHHLLLDGWSVPLLLKEVLIALEGLRIGRELTPEPSRPYRDFISWLKRQDRGRAEEFWRRRLRGFRTPSSLPAVERGGVSRLRDQVNYERRDRIISARTTTLLRTLGREHHLSPNTWVQGAWALLLADRSGRTDVVFGVTSAGRPIALSGFEAMVGMFVTTLPARFETSGDRQLLPWLQAVQRLQVEAREYEYASLMQIQRWSEVPAGVPLFETQQVFENYPVDWNVNVNLGIASKLQISEHRAFTRSSYPVTFVSTLAGEELALKILFDTDRFDVSTIDAALDDLVAILTKMVQEPSVVLGELGNLLSERERLRQAKKETKLSEARLRILNRVKREAVPHRKEE